MKMEKPFVTGLMLISILASFFGPMSCFFHESKIAEDPQSVAQWFTNLPQAKEQTTKLHFYFQDIVSGPNPTAITVAQARSTPKSKTSFGMVRVMDDPLTEGPGLNTKILGRAQGIYVADSLGEFGLLMTLNFVFTSGPFSGSTLSVLGHNPIFHTYRELPIVGGSGVFRLARGIATAHTISFNATSQDATVEYNVIVLHY